MSIFCSVSINLSLKIDVNWLNLFISNITIMQSLEQKRSPVYKGMASFSSKTKLKTSICKQIYYQYQKR